MKRYIVACTALPLVIGCAAVARERPEAAPDHAPSLLASDSTYGYTPDDPIKIGGVNDPQPNANQLRYLEALRGPQGQEVRFARKGSCCKHPTPNGVQGQGLLDMYEVTYDGLAQPVTLYLSLYNLDELRAPVGFRLPADFRLR